MKHFSEARQGVREAIKNPALAPRLEQAAILWDLRGRLRLLVKPAENVDVPALRAELVGAMAAAAEGFWSGELWLWDDESDLAAKRVYEQAWKESQPIEPGVPKIRELDKHLSKETWFGKPVAPPWPPVAQTPPIIAFFSFKGGVGRTTALASIAIQLARAGKRVCVVDLDLEAPGAGSLLASATGPASHGVVDYLLDRPAHAGPGFDLNDYYIEYDDQAVIGDGPPISVVPAGGLDDLYLEKLARVDYERLLNPDPEPRSPLTSLLSELRAHRQPDYVLIDSRAGLHDIGGLALNGIAHLDLLFGLDNEQSWAGLRLVLNHLGRRRIEAGDRQQDCALVYAMAPASTAPDRAERIGHFADQAFKLFSELFYDAEPEGGWPAPPPPEAWPVPEVDAPDEPHYPFAVGFSSELQQARRLADMAGRLTEGDYRQLLEWLLSRIGRNAP